MPNIPAGVETKSLVSLADRISGAWNILFGRRPSAAEFKKPETADGLNATNSRDFGPLTPLPARYGPDSAEATGPRQFIYPVGSNIIVEPRAEIPGLTPFYQLRNLAALYDVASVCVATRIEQVQGMGWSVQAKDKRRQVEYQDACDFVTNFFRRPDGLNPFETWIGMLIREHLVTDAVTIYPQLSYTNDLLALEQVDGASIKPLIDDRGRVRAYQQILYGYPASNYARQGIREHDFGDDHLEFPIFSTGELMYLPRFVSVASPYGSPPTEWIILRINQALRKQTWDISYFTEGNIPDMLATMPPGTMTPEQIEEFERNFNALLQGNEAMRRMIRFLPYQAQVQELRPYSYETTLDDWMLRVTCAAYAVPPQEIGFTNDVNRATAELQEAVNERRGLKPLVTWIKRAILDEVIYSYFASDSEDTTISLPDTPTRRPIDPFREIEWAWSFGDKTDKATEASMYETYIGANVLSPDEVRSLVFSGIVEGSAPLTPEQREASRPVPADGTGGGTAEAESPMRPRLGAPAAPETEPEAGLEGEAGMGETIQTIASAELCKSDVWREMSSSDRRIYEYRLANQLRLVFDTWARELSEQALTKGLEPHSFYNNMTAEVSVIIRRFLREIEEEARRRFYQKSFGPKRIEKKPSFAPNRLQRKIEATLVDLPGELITDIRKRCRGLLALGFAVSAAVATAVDSSSPLHFRKRNLSFDGVNLEAMIVAVSVDVANSGWRALSTLSKASARTALRPPLHPHCRCKLRPKKIGGNWVAIWWTDHADACRKQHPTPWGVVNGCIDLRGRCVTSGPHLGQKI